MAHYAAGCWDAEIESSYGGLVGPSVLGLLTYPHMTCVHPLTKVV
ncbi:putative glycine--tRNA ligase [Helianthus annuus]|nr:putative glycine--tRNA ligase [Helianthus annuus]